METEDQLIPFHSTDLTGNRVLVLAPHADDETIGCGGAIALHARAGDPVRVVVMTNGAKGDMEGRFERNAYIRMRQQEARSACACLGISDIVFWDHEDRELAGAENAVSDLVALIDTFCPELIYAPSPLEFHPDHRAASDFIQKAVRFCSNHPELLFYEVTQPVQADVLVDITGVLDLKKQAIQKYQSQLEERPYDDVALSLNRFRRLTLPKDVTHAEGFVRCGYRPILSTDENLPANKTHKTASQAQIHQAERELPQSGLPAAWNPGATAIRKADEVSRVSVIIPLYNHEKYIESAIESVLAQTLPPAEIIIIDDGSVDGSAEKVRRLCKAHPEIIFWSWSNQGAHHTLNAAILRATGDFVAILNSDDCYHPERLAACLATVQSDPSIDMVVTGISFMDDTGNDVENPWYEDALTFYTKEGNISLALFHANFIVTTSNLFVRRSVFEWIGCFSPLRYTHDLEFCLRLILGKRHLHFLERPLLSYRMHAANTIAENKAKVDVETAVVFAFFIYRKIMTIETEQARHSWLEPYTEILGQQELLETVEQLLAILYGNFNGEREAAADALSVEFLSLLSRLGVGWVARDAGGDLIKQFVSARNAYYRRKETAGGDPNLVSQLKANIKWLTEQCDAWKKAAEDQGEQMRIGISWLTEQRDAWKKAAEDQAEHMQTEINRLSTEIGKCHATLQELGRSRIFKALVRLHLLRISYLPSNSGGTVEGPPAGPRDGFTVTRS